jgi:putative proteasome-type protease
VGLPLDIRIYDIDSLQPGRELTIVEDDPYYQMISNAWGEALKTSLSQLPKFVLDGD